MKKIKHKEKKKLRLKSNQNGKSNELMRVSNNFARKAEHINDQREENGFDRLSNPKITELIIRHLKSWARIEQDIIHFNTALDPEEQEEEEFSNEK